MTAFKGTDPPFTPCAPAKGGTGKPTAFRAGLLLQHDVADYSRRRRAFIGRGEAAVDDGQLPGAWKVRGPRLGLLNLDEPLELSRLGQPALSDDLGVRLEQTPGRARAKQAAEEVGAS
jgi:hypothetical protein